MIKLIAFDWNGTLLADTTVTWRADNTAMRALGLKPISLTRFRQCFDIPIIQYWRNVGLTENFIKNNLEKLENAFRDDYQKNERKSSLRAYGRQTLQFLQKNNISSIVYSNAPNHHLQAHIQRLKLKGLIQAALGREDKDFSHLLSRGKQKRLSEFVKNHKLKPKEVVSVGDSIEEVEIGKHLGYHTVAITGGYCTAARMKKHKPDFLIHNMKELAGIVKKLNNR